MVETQLFQKILYFGPTIVLCHCCHWWRDTLIYSSHQQRISFFQTDHCTTPLQYPHRTEVDQPNRFDHEGPPGPQSQRKILSEQVGDDEEPQGSGNPVAQPSTTTNKVRDDEEPQGSGNHVAQQSTTTDKVRDDEEPQGSGNPEAWKHALCGITSPVHTSSSPLLNLPQDHPNICASLRGRGVTVSVLLKVQGFALRTINDSGAETTILNRSVAEKIGLDYTKNPAIPIHGAFQTQLTNAHLTRTDICIGTGKYNWDLLVAESNDDVLLGLISYILSELKWTSRRRFSTSGQTRCQSSLLCKFLIHLPAPWNWTIT